MKGEVSSAKRRPQSARCLAVSLEASLLRRWTVSRRPSLKAWRSSLFPRARANSSSACSRALSASALGATKKGTQIEGFFSCNTSSSLSCAGARVVAAALLSMDPSFARRSLARTWPSSGALVLARRRRNWGAVRRFLGGVGGGGVGDRGGGEVEAASGVSVPMNAAIIGMKASALAFQSMGAGAIAEGGGNPGRG